MEIKDRLQQLIDYKTGGRQTDFARLTGWTPQYLFKLLKGKDFGLRPCLTLLEVMPEVNARWLLLGEGTMLTDGGCALTGIRRDILNLADRLMSLESLLPFMTEAEVRTVAKAIQWGRRPVFSPDRLSELRNRAVNQQRNVDAHVRQAMIKSDEKLCRQQTAKE